jgi:hypothetical protein
MIMPIVFGSVGTALGMGPVFWLDALMLAAAAWLMGRDASARTGGRVVADRTAGRAR